jgi:hypothetical protein
MSGRSGDKRGESPITPGETEAFDRWLRKQLHGLYGAIASEPLPENLIALVDGDARARQRATPERNGSDACHN